MTFLNAGLLGLGALFTVPLIIHLLNRRRYVRVQWAAMDFLLKAFQQNRRRLRLESLLLLLLRCAIPLLLALAVARPRLATSLPISSSSQGPHHVFVLDRSYSMGYRGAAGLRPFDRMKKLAGALVDRIALSGNEKVSLIYFGGDVTTPVRGDLDVTKAQKALTALAEPGAGRAELVPALVEAQKLVKAEPEPARVYVFSDFQSVTLGSDASAETQSRAGTEARTGGAPSRAPRDAQAPPAAAPAATPLQRVRDLCADLGELGARVMLFPVAPAEPIANTQVVGLALEPENAVARVRGRVRGSLLHRGREAIDVICTLTVDGANEQRQPVQLRPGEPHEVTFGVQFLEPGMHAVELRIEEDALPIDDARLLTARVRDRIRVLLVEGHETAHVEPILTHSYLLAHMLDPTGGEGAEELTIFQTTLVDEDRFQQDASWFQGQDVIVLLNVSGPRDDIAARLTRFVEAGGGLLLAPGPASAADSYNAKLFGIKGEGGPMPLRLLEIGGFKPTLGAAPSLQDPARFATAKIVATDHPIVADFEHDELRTFLEALPIYRFWTTSRADQPENTQIVIDLSGTEEQDRPALIAARRFGQGECVLLTSGMSLRPDRWNRLDAIDAVSFPLVHSLCHYLAREPKESLNRLVGEPLNAWIAHEPKSLYMHRPGDAGRVPLTAKAIQGREGEATIGWRTTPFENTQDAGLYRLTIEHVEKTRPATDVLFAVNPDPAEGVLDYLRIRDLERELPGVEIREDIELETVAAVDTGSSELGHTLLLLALACALAESLLASFIGGRRER